MNGRKVTPIPTARCCPPAPDARIDAKKTNVGYEAPFNSPAISGAGDHVIQDALDAAQS